MTITSFDDGQSTSLFINMVFLSSSNGLTILEPMDGRIVRSAFYHHIGTRLHQYSAFCLQFYRWNQTVTTTL